MRGSVTKYQQLNEKLRSAIGRDSHQVAPGRSRAPAAGNHRFAAAQLELAAEEIQHVRIHPQVGQRCCIAYGGSSGRIQLGQPQVEAAHEGSASSPSRKSGSLLPAVQ